MQRTQSSLADDATLCQATPVTTHHLPRAPTHYRRLVPRAMPPVSSGAHCQLFFFPELGVVHEGARGKKIKGPTSFEGVPEPFSLLAPLRPAAPARFGAAARRQHAAVAGSRVAARPMHRSCGDAS